jgi:cytochrome c oxidase subunit II
VTTFQWHMPANAALHGAALDRQMALNLTIFVALGVLAQVVLLTGILLRRAPQPLAHSRWRLEYLPLGGFTLLFFALAWHSERLWAAMRYSGADPAAMQVEVVGMQFAWYFRYPGKDAAFGATEPKFVAPGEGNPAGIDPADERGRDDFVRGALVLPAGREVDLRLRALDVIHGFAIPALRVKQNALPGQVFHIHFTPTVPGEYAVLCTQVCGLGHYRMQAVVRVLPPAEYDAWAREQRP